MRNAIVAIIFGLLLSSNAYANKNENIKIDLIFCGSSLGNKTVYLKDTFDGSCPPSEPMEITFKEFKKKYGWQINKQLCYQPYEKKSSRVFLTPGGSCNRSSAIKIKYKGGNYYYYGNKEKEKKKREELEEEKKIAKKPEGEERETNIIKLQCTGYQGYGNLKSSYTSRNQKRLIDRDKKTFKYKFPNKSWRSYKVHDMGKFEVSYTRWGHPWSFNFVTYKSRPLAQTESKGYTQHDCNRADFAIAEKPEKKEPKEVNKSDLIPIATGSGFFVSRDGYVVTNEHVAGICELMEIKVDGKKHYLNVVKTDLVNDLGLIKGSYKHPKYLEIDIEGPNLGEEIVAMGYPLGKYTGADVKISKGIVSSLSGPGNNYSEFQHDAATAKGHSGGPIINKSGQVVGVIFAGVDKMKILKETKGHIPEGIFFAVSSQTLTNFLKANKVRYTKAYRDKKLETEEVAQIGDAATVKLYCLNTKEFHAALKKAESHSDVLLDLK